MQTIAEFKSNDLKSGIKSNLPDLQPELSHFQKPGIGLGFLVQKSEISPSPTNTLIFQEKGYFFQKK